MLNGSGPLNSALRAPSEAAPAPKLLVELEPAYRVFCRNLADLLLFRRPKPAGLISAPAPFWSDVFVSRRPPWGKLGESLLLHVLAIAVLWSSSRAWMMRPHAVPSPPTPVFNQADLIYFSPAEYLPPLDTGSTPAREPQKGEPELARQPIISVPPEADNRTQTIITPPNVKLTHDVPVPNIVAWNEAAPSVPISATERSQLTVPAVPTQVVAPPPEVSVASSRTVMAPQTAVIEPPPTVQDQVRTIGDLGIAHAEVVAPAPQLPVDGQRAIPAAIKAAMGDDANQVVPPPPSVHGISGNRRVSGTGSTTAQVVPPPPSVEGAGGSGAGGRIIALGIHPAAEAPPTVVGNRRGTFAATPEGKPGATGTPNIAGDPPGGHSGGNGGKSANAASGQLPSGLFVGAAPKNAPVSAVDGDPASSASGSGSGAASASAAASAADPALPDKPMRVTVTPHRALVSTRQPTELERQVFGNRKFYSMVLNMPNFNSAVGSWILRFAELKDDGDPADLMAPEATSKVDPGYPLELRRLQVEGTVMLYAVIHSDGSVGGVRVLSSPDDRLDEFARVALSRWRFRPATKNGNPVALEAVVMVPFRAQKF